MSSFRHLKRMLLANIRSPMTERGLVRQRQSLFYRCTKDGWIGALVVFKEYDYLGSLLHFCIKYDIVNKLIDCASDQIGMSGWPENELKKLRKERENEPTFWMSYNPIIGLYKLDTDNVVCSDEVATLCDQLIEKYDKAFPTFSTAFGDISSVAKMYENDDPFLKLLYNGNDSSVRLHGVATLRAVHGRNAAQRYLDRVGAGSPKSERALAELVVEGVGVYT